MIEYPTSNYSKNKSLIYIELYSVGVKRILLSIPLDYRLYILYRITLHTKEIFLCSSLF